MRALRLPTHRPPTTVGKILEEEFCPSLQFWVNLQSMIDLYLAIHAPKATEIGERG